jgi:serine/threonine-protein kinase PpkA
MLQIPGYQIIRPLGEGGMATVYLAVQENLGRQVALKVMSNQLVSVHPGYGERFLHEARTIATLVHPHILTVHDVGKHNGLYYLAMAYVPGGDLRCQREQLSLRQSVIVLQQIAQALDFAHQRGYVHGDVKPENILVDGNHALLSDFGIARLAGDGRAGGGTPSYMSPEQAAGRPLDHRADLYSLGIVLFWLVRGRLPYAPGNGIPLDVQHISEPVPCLPAEVIPFQTVVDRAMAKQPEARFNSGAEFAEALAEVLPSINYNMEVDWRDLVSRANGPRIEEALFDGLSDGMSDGQPPSRSEPMFTFHPSEPSMQPLWVPEPMLEERFVLRPPGRHFPAPPRRGSRLGQFTALMMLLLATAGTAAVIWQQLPAEHQLVRFVSRLIDGPGATVASTPMVKAIATEASPAVAVAPVTTTASTSGASLLTKRVVEEGAGPIDASLRQRRADAVERLTDESGPNEIELAANIDETVVNAPEPEIEALVPEVVDNSAVIVANQLALADAAVKAGRLTEPREHSAVGYYQQVLQQDPNNLTAQTGLHRIATTLARRGGERLDLGDPARATAFLQQAKAVQPRNREVKRLEQQLEAAQRAESARPLLNRARRAHAQGALIAPAEDNAFDLYHQVLRRDWGSHLALRGLAEVEVQLADEIERLWRAGNGNEAQSLYWQALQRYPSSSDLQDAGRNIGVLRQNERKR